MSYGPVKVYSTSIASGAATAVFDFGEQAYFRAVLEKPTFSTGALLNFDASHDGSTWRTMYVSHIDDTPAGSVSHVVFHATFTVGTATSAGFYELPLFTRYMRVTASAAVAGGATLRVYCHT